MSRLYNKHFKIGACLAVVAFVLGNVVSYLAASERAAKLSISFAPASFPAWGFPFNWDGGWGSIFNAALMLFGALFFGLLFRWLTGIFK
jgi:hypothetical protein